MSSSTRHPGLYVAYFLILFVVFYALYHLIGPVLPHYYAALAHSVCWFLGWFDPAVSCEANYILYDSAHRLVVVEGCDGLSFIVLILAAVLPFPTTLRHKLIGLSWLIMAILVVNWLRLVILTVFQLYIPAAFDFMHVYLFQPLMIAFTLVLFLFWMTRSHERASPTA